MMPKMNAPFALASAICHLATVAVIIDTRIGLSTVHDMPAGPHRNLLESTDADSLETRMNEVVATISTRSGRG